MNYRSWLLILSFFCGVIVANLVKERILLTVVPLLQIKSSINIKNDLLSYLGYVLWVRGRMVAVLYLLQKGLRNKQILRIILSHTVGALIAIGYGIIFVAFVISDGAQAVLRAIITIVPHGGCYLYACYIWMKATKEQDNQIYTYGKNRIITSLFQKKYTWKILFFLLIGSVFEGIFPILLQEMLKKF